MLKIFRVLNTILQNSFPPSTSGNNLNKDKEGTQNKTFKEVLDQEIEKLQKNAGK